MDITRVSVDADALEHLLRRRFFIDDSARVLSEAVMKVLPASAKAVLDRVVSAGGRSCVEVDLRGDLITLIGVTAEGDRVPISRVIIGR